MQLTEKGVVDGLVGTVVGAGVALTYGVVVSSILVDFMVVYLTAFISGVKLNFPSVGSSVVGRGRVQFGSAVILTSDSVLVVVCCCPVVVVIVDVST